MLSFTAGSLSRGLEYYRHGRVRSLETDGRVIMAQVAGTRPEPYAVRVNLRIPAQSFCSCPVRGSCKHMVATIRAVLAGELDNALVEETLRGALDPGQLSALEGPPAAAPEAAVASGKDRILNLEAAVTRAQRRSAGDGEGGRSHGDGAPNAVRGGRQELRILPDPSLRWRLVFVVGRSIEIDGLPLPGPDGPTLHAARQYRRKDGDYGRLDSLRPGATVYGDCPAAAVLAEELLLLGGSAPVLAVAEKLRESTAPLFLSEGFGSPAAKRRPARVAHPERIEITVRPLGELQRRASLPRGPARQPSTEGDSPLLLGVELRINGEEALRPESAVTCDQGIGSALCLHEDGLLLVDDDSGPLPELCRLRGHLGLLGSNWAERLAGLKQLARRFPDRISLSYPGSVRVVTVEPAATFLILGGRRRENEGAYYLLLGVDSDGVPDGFYDGEYRIHRRGSAVPEQAIGDAESVVGSEGVYEASLDGWMWELELRRRPARGLPEPLRTGLALLEAGYPVYIEDPDGTRRRLKKPLRLSVSVRSGIDWFTFTVNREDRVGIDLDLLDELCREGALRDAGTVIPLTPEDIERLRKILDITEGREDRGFSRWDFAAAAEAWDLADFVDPDVEAIRNLAEEILGRRGGGEPAPAPLPADLQADLRPYQKEGFRWLTRLARHDLSGCLADDMGLGKTLQALTFMLWLQETSDSPHMPGGFLVVAPVSTLANWRNEAARFSPTLTRLIHHGQGRLGNIDLIAEYDLVITSYATVLRDEELLSGRAWRLICLDEGQFIKNPYARTRKSVKRLQGDLRLVLTGTPVENVSTDLWSIMDFLNPGMLGSQGEFNARFPKRGNPEKEQTRRRFARLQRTVAPFLLRRTKEAVAPELPARTESLSTCHMGARQARFYETLRSYHHDRVEAAILSRDRAQIGTEVFTGLLRLRQAALYPEDAGPAGEGLPSAKESELLARLREVTAEGHRALVFSQFVSALQRFRRAAQRAGMQTLYLDGSTRDRASIIDQFQGAETPTVFFISLKASGTGINLTAADYVFICDPWWNPQVEKQAVDRAHRIGRERPVLVTRLVTAGSVEEKVLELQDKKRHLAADLIAENASGLTGASAEELLALFEYEG